MKKKRWIWRGAVGTRQCQNLLSLPWIYLFPSCHWTHMTHTDVWWQLKITNPESDLSLMQHNPDLNTTSPDNEWAALKLLNLNVSRTFLKKKNTWIIYVYYNLSLIFIVSSITSVCNNKNVITRLIAAMWEQLEQWWNVTTVSTFTPVLYLNTILSDWYILHISTPTSSTYNINNKNQAEPQKLCYYYYY